MAEAIAGHWGGSLVGGGANGALVGGSIGSVGGPWGIAIGSMVGGATGVVAAFHQLEKETKQAKLGKALTDLDFAATDFAKMLEQGIGKIPTGKLNSKLNGLSYKQASAFAAIDEAAGSKITEGESAGLGLNKLIDNVFGGGLHFHRQRNLILGEAAQQKVGLMEGNLGHYDTILEQGIANHKGPGSFLDTAEGKKAMLYRAQLASQREEADILSKGGNPLSEGDKATVLKRNLDIERATQQENEKNGKALRANLSLLENFTDVLNKQAAGLTKFTSALDDLSIVTQHADTLAVGE